MTVKRKKVTKVHYRHSRRKAPGEHLRSLRGRFPSVSKSGVKSGVKSGTKARSGSRTRPGAGRKHASSKKSTLSAAQARSRRIKAIICIVGALVIAALVFFHVNTHPNQIGDGGYTHAAKFSDRIAVNGIDVSYVQGSGINWRKVKKSGVDFVFIRAGYRMSESGKIDKDSTFDTNVRHAKAAGLMVGAYFYSQATSVKEAKAEANKLTEYVGDNEMDLPLVMDFETLQGGRLEKYLNKKKTTKARVDKILLAFCSTVKKQGYEPAVYANYNMLSYYMNADKIAQHADVWLAHYADSTDYPNDYTFWQSSYEMKVNGIKNEVDRDFWYLDPDGMTTRGARNDGARSIADCTISLRKHSYYALGRPVEPKVIVKYNRKRLKEGRDYRVGYIKNSAPGKAYAVVTGIGDYKDMKATGFRIKSII